MEHMYELKNTDTIISPSLIYYEEIIRENIKKAIRTAGSPERLWPHVKSHKSKDMVRMQMEYGITKFKTATVAEAEMAAKGNSGLSADWSQHGTFREAGKGISGYGILRCGG